MEIGLNNTQVKGVTMRILNKKESKIVGGGWISLRAKMRMSGCSFDAHDNEITFTIHRRNLDRFNKLINEYDGQCKDNLANSQAQVTSAFDDLNVSFVQVTYLDPNSISEICNLPVCKEPISLTVS